MSAVFVFCVVPRGANFAGQLDLCELTTTFKRLPAIIYSLNFTTREVFTFFMISTSFIISHSHKKDQNPNQKMTAGTRLNVRKVFRVKPSYFCYIL